MKTAVPILCLVHGKCIVFISPSGSPIKFKAGIAPFAPLDNIPLEDLNSTEMAGGAALDQDVKLAVADGVPFVNIFAHDEGCVY
jgi:hypothetical protein